jgi:hypothetical protein
MHFVVIKQQLLLPLHMYLLHMLVKPYNNQHSMLLNCKLWLSNNKLHNTPQQLNSSSNNNNKV